MNKLILIGAGGHSRAVIAAALLSKKWKIEGILDLNYQESKDESILDIPVIGSIDKLRNLSQKDISIFISIGDNKTRQNLLKESFIGAFNKANIIHPNSLIDKTAELGDLNFIGPFANIGPSVKIGNCNIINSYANIEHESKIGNFSQIAPGAVICGRCNIRDNVYIGANSTIIQGLSINSNNIVGAGSVINTNINYTGKTIVGVPGKPI